MAVNKKCVKIGVAGLAVVALVIGLSVSLTQKSKTKSAEMGASAATDGSSVHSDFDKDADCSSSSSKSGKSGGNSSKSGKSGGRMLVVPGTEEYVNGVGMGKRRKLRKELIRGKFIGCSQWLFSLWPSLKCYLFVSWYI